MVSTYQPALQELMGKNLKADRLNAIGDLPEALASADVVSLSVSEPTRRREVSVAWAKVIGG